MLGGLNICIYIPPFSTSASSSCQLSALDWPLLMGNLIQYPTHGQKHFSL